MFGEDMSQSVAMEVKLRTVRSIVDRLRSAAPDSDTAAHAIAEIRLLSKHDAGTRTLLADAGAVPLLAAHLGRHDSDDSTRENAGAALLNLSISAREALMSTPDLLGALTAALCLPAPAPAADHAAATVYSLLCAEANRPVIGSNRPMLAALVALVRDRDAPTGTVKDALKALFGLALYPPNRAALVEAGAVPELFELAEKDGRRGVVEDATAVIAQVAGCHESLQAFRRVAGVTVLVDLVGRAARTSMRARENAAAALLNLAVSGGEEAVWDVMDVEGALEAVRELAAGGGGVSERGKSKAEALLRVLESERLQQLSGELDAGSWPAISSPSVSDGGARLNTGR